MKIRLPFAIAIAIACVLLNAGCTRDGAQPLASGQAGGLPAGAAGAPSTELKEVTLEVLGMT
jgi:hypothetical protein